MTPIFMDEFKINFFAQLQEELITLNQNANDEEINEFINKIPENYLRQKDDLKEICELFAIYTRHTPQNLKRNSFKLFDKIKKYMKEQFKGESPFLWNIFGGLYYFKYLMYEEGFISIEYIIQYIQRYNNIIVAEYFLPEIIEFAPDIYNKELKHFIKLPYSAKSLLKHKEIREKHIKWIKESGDFNDPSYLEIEANKLRLAVKLDDIDLFQKMISNLNISINSMIKESIYDNFLLNSNEMSLFEYAIYYKATKIINFMIMNDVILTDSIVFASISTNNYDLIHFCRSKINSKFIKFSLGCSISTWNIEIMEYILDNYDEYNFLYKKDEINDEKQNNILELMSTTFKFMNIKFFKDVLLPFLNKNHKFFEDNINEITLISIREMSGFFAKEFLKHNLVDINYYSKRNESSFLGKAIEFDNISVIENLIMNPNVDVNLFCREGFTPLTYGVGIYSDIKTIDLLFKHPKLNFHLKNRFSDIEAFTYSATRGNFYALKYFINKVDYYNYSLTEVIFKCLTNRHLLALKIMLEYWIKKYPKTNINLVKKDLKNKYQYSRDYSPEFLKEFESIYNEIIGFAQLILFTIVFPFICKIKIFGD